MKYIALIACLLASAASYAEGTVIRGVSTDGKNSFQAFGKDFVLYNGKSRMARCTFDETNKGIDDGGSPYILDIFQCDRSRTLAIKTFGNINDGGWVFIVENGSNGRPTTTFQKAFLISDGSKSL